MSTMSFGSLYPGYASGQSATNAPKGTASMPSVAPGNPGSNQWGNVPVLSGVSSGLGISVPMLLALGVMAWYLFRIY